jgi:biofilm PGA synthesis N-glycosyltransferase PgaC
VIYCSFSSAHVPVDGLEEIRFVILLLFSPILIKYFIHLAVAPWYARVIRRRSKGVPGSYSPSVSVLIPAWNEEVGIVATLRSVLATGYPALEVIVVDDGSTDGTGEAVMAFQEERGADPTCRPPHLIYRRVPNGGKARALNRALAEARGEIVVTVDADSVMHRDFLRRIVRPFLDPRVASVAGNVAIGNGRGFLGLMQQLEYLYGFYFKRADTLLNAVYIVGGAAAAYRRGMLVAAGGFDERIITEDIELSTRLLRHGHKVDYVADAMVYTEGPSDWRGLCRQRHRWKYGRLLTFHRYRDLFFRLGGAQSPFLTWLILPVALFAEGLLLIEPLLLSIFYGYTLITLDFLPLLVALSLICAVVAVQVVSDPQPRYHRRLLLLAPVAWLLFYVMDAVEYRALLCSLRDLVRRRRVGWQRWSRRGVFGDAVAS